MSVIQMLMSWNGYVAGTQTFITPGSDTWLCPVGVYSVTAECWGAGGAGGSTQFGAAGGGFARRVLIVTPGINYSIAIGAGGASGTNADGTDSWFGSSGTILAYGGFSGINTGVGRSGTGTTNYTGGNGLQLERYYADTFGTCSDGITAGETEYYFAGSGGGGAGSSGNGAPGVAVNANPSAGGAGGSGVDGAGGTGGYQTYNTCSGSTTQYAGGTGSSIGGGGGGAPRGNTTLSGAGGRGQVRLTW